MRVINIRREIFGGIMHIFTHYGAYSYKFNRVPFRVLELLVLNNEIDDIISAIEKEFNVSFSADQIMSFIDKIKNMNIKISEIEKYTLDKKDIELWKNSLENQEIDKLRSPLHVYWQITNVCNLRCKHCNASSGVADKNELSDEELNNILDEFIKNKILFISFTGGEPLAKKERLYYLARKARENGISIWLATNAVLITEEVAKELKDIGFSSIQVSIDGIKNHDVIRGEGAFVKTLEGIDNLQKANIEATLCMAIMKPGMKEIKDVIDLAVSKNIKKIKFIRFLPLGRGEESRGLGFSPSEELECAKMLFELQDRYKNEIRLVLNDTYPKFAQTIHEDISVLNDWDCLSARAFSYVDSTGNFSPCAYAAVAGLHGGNAKEKEILDIWENSELFNKMRMVKNNQYCKSCESWDLCEGGCKVAAYVKYGDIMMPDSLCIKNTGE